MQVLRLEKAKRLLETTRLGFEVFPNRAGCKVASGRLPLGATDRYRPKLSLAVLQHADQMTRCSGHSA